MLNNCSWLFLCASVSRREQAQATTGRHSPKAEYSVVYSNSLRLRGCASLATLTSSRKCLGRSFGGVDRNVSGRPNMSRNVFENHIMLFVGLYLIQFGDQLAPHTTFPFRTNRWPTSHRCVV